MSHFLELKTDLEVPGSGHSADLTEDEAYALWTRVRSAIDLLVSYVPSSVACNPPYNMGGSICSLCNKSFCFFVCMKYVDGRKSGYAYNPNTPASYFSFFILKNRRK
jgi:hypothetical protein